MAEGKYGRLFTEDDVLLLLRYAAQRGEVDGYAKLGQADGQNVDPGERLLVEYEAETGDAPFDDLPPLTFPADEPLFLLRGQDVAAPRAIGPVVIYGGRERAVLGYTAMLAQAGASERHRSAAAQAAQRMYDWQRSHPDRVKVPD